MRKILLVTTCVLALALGMTYNFWQDGTKPNYGLIPFVLFGLALAIGIIRRLVVARRDGNARQGLVPLRDASATYESLLLGRGRETLEERMSDTSNHLPGDPRA